MSGAAWRRNMKKGGTVPKMLIVGVDAGSVDLFERWMSTGDMPNLAAMKQSGCWGRVVNPYALEAGAVWPVFHAGLRPGNFRQYDGRRYFDPGDYETRWYEAEQTPPPFWRQLSDQGLDCLLLDPPYMHADPAIRGRMVVDWGGHVPANGQQFHLRTVPESLRDEVLAQVGPDPVGGVMCDILSPESIEDYREFLGRYLTRIEKRGALASRLLSEGDWQFALIASMDLHCTGHHLWHVNDRSHPDYRPELEAALGEPLRDCYRAFDRSLGRMLEAVDDDTTVLLFGSHGMGPQYTGTGLLDRILLALDRGRPAMRARSLKTKLRTFWRRMPVEWRARLRHVRKPFSGKLHAPRFLGDHANRRFFEVYANNASGGIRINLKGRECHGRVEPQDYDALVKQICEQLREVVNVDTGEPLVDDVIVTREHYHGDHVHALPDVLVRWNRRAPIRLVRSERIGTIAQEAVDNRTGDHTPDGIFYACGPGVSATGPQPDVRAEDFAPTVARFLGFDEVVTDGVPIAVFEPQTSQPEQQWPRYVGDAQAEPVAMSA